MDDLARHLDFANHHADSTPDDIKSLCADVLRYGFHTVFVNATYVRLAKSLVQGKAKVGCVISFPLGQDSTAAKAAAANAAVSDGADELDVVPNLGLYLAGDTNGFVNDMTAVVEAARMYGRPVIVKFILDPGYFDALPNKKEAMTEAARLIQLSGADFVKIGSGMGPRNPTAEDVAIIRKAVPQMHIKVAGGVTTTIQTETLLAAGAERIGTSHAIDIVKGSAGTAKSSGE